MRIAIRQTSMTLACMGLLLGVPAMAADWARQDNHVAASAESISAAPGQPAAANVVPNRTTAIPDSWADREENDATIIGEHTSPAQGLFGNTPPPVCELCGGGNCMPPPWSIEAGIGIIGTSRANDHVLGTNSLPFGPLQVTAGTGQVGQGQQQTLQYAFLNNAVNTPVFEVHTLNPTVSPALNLTIAHFLGRDGERRDHFLEFGYMGLERFSDEANTQGIVIPVYDPAATAGDQKTPGTILFFTGSLLSPFAFPHSATSPFINPTPPQNYDPTNAYAFNGATSMSAATWTTFNSWEINYRIAGNNQQDQMVLNPNGRWYRQCKTGFFFSYLFGIRSMVLNEMFEFISSGATFTNSNRAPGDAILVNHGRYVARTQNTLLGLQTGGTLEYRFCRWALEARGKAGMFINFANQDSLVQTALHGQEYYDSFTPIDQDLTTAYNSGTVNVAFAGGFGVAGSYKFRPNLVGRVGYDMFWVGDVARAAEQMQFGPNIIPEINTKGSQFYDGVTLSMEYDW